MIYVEEVRSNLKTGVACKLGPRTLIIGPTGSGKSSVLNSIELACTGSVSNIVFKDQVQREIDLLRLAKDRVGTLAVEAKLSDGSICSWISSDAKGRKKAKHYLPAGVKPEEVFPLRELKRELFGVSSDNARRFLLSKICSKLTTEAVVDRIPTALREQFDRIWPLDMEPVDALLKAVEVAAAEARTASAQARAFKADAEASGLVAVSEAQMAEAVRARDAALEVLTEAIRAESTPATPALSKSAPTSAPTQMRLLVSKLSELQHWHARQGESSCMLCGTEVKPGTFERRAQEADSYLRDAATPTIIPAPKPVAAPSAAVVDARSAHAAAQDRVTVLATQASAWNRAKAARENAATMEQTADAWGRLREALDQAIAELLTGAVSTFVEMVQSYLHEGYRFFLQMQDGARDLPVWGLERNGVQHTSISDGEAILVSLAMAMAMNPVGTGLRIFCPEDRALDAEALSAALLALSSAPFQVILMTVVEPSSIPEGWTVIRTGLGEHQELGVPAVAAPPPAGQKRRRAEPVAVEAPAPPPSSTHRAIMDD